MQTAAAMWQEIGRKGDERGRAALSRIERYCWILAFVGRDAADLQAVLRDAADWTSDLERGLRWLGRADLVGASPSVLVRHWPAIRAAVHAHLCEIYDLKK